VGRITPDEAEVRPHVSAAARFPDDTAPEAADVSRGHADREDDDLTRAS
jgi:hypothetical protein